MALALTATKTAPDTVRFDVTGIDTAAAPTVSLDLGDASAPLTLTTVAGAATATHTYTDPGHHSYTAKVTAALTPYARTLAELAAAGQITDSMFAAQPDGGPFDSNRETGHRFTVNTAGVIRAIRYGRTSTNPVTARQVNLWDNATQALIASVQVTGETGSGWKVATLTPAAPVVAGRSYVASYNSRDRSPVIQPIPAGAAVHLTSNSPVNNNAGANLFPSAVGTSFTYADVVFSPYGGTLGQLDAVPTLNTLADIPRSQVTAAVTVTVDVGPATIYATVISGDPIPRVQVDLWIGNPGTVIGWRVDRDQPADSTPIWTGETTSGAMSLIDHTAPLGVPITYRLTLTYADFSTVAVSAPAVTITGTVGCYLTDPATGVTLRVELATWPTRRFVGRQAVLPVLGRRDPVVLSDVHSTGEGVWTFITRTDPATAALLAVLANVMGIVVYRAQPGSSIPSVTAAIGVIEERRYSGAGDDQRRLVACEVQEIAPLPATALPLPATLGGLATYAGEAGDTLGELSQLRPTLLQLSMIVTG